MAPKRSEHPRRQMARVHVLYIEQAEDQRGADKKRVPGIHLGVPKLGPTLCQSCGGVVDVWRGRLDNAQTSLRMCCAEGSLFRPWVAQFIVLSPRVALRYDVPRLGAWMAAAGTKRVTEAVVVGSALRVVAGEMSSKDSGIEHFGFEPTSEGTSEAMWTWLQRAVDSIRSRATADGGRCVALTLDKSAPMLTPSMTAGTIASHFGEPSNISDIIVVIGGPAGVPVSWQPRVDAALREPIIKVSLRGTLQHSYGALLDVLLMHERNELVPAILDRLVLTPHQLAQWMQAEQELLRTWLGYIGCVRRRSARSTHLGSPTLSPVQDPSSPAAPPTLDAVLERHRSVLQKIAGKKGSTAPEFALSKKERRKQKRAAQAFSSLSGREPSGAERSPVGRDSAAVATLSEGRRGRPQQMKKDVGRETWPSPAAASGKAGKKRKRKGP